MKWNVAYRARVDSKLEPVFYLAGLLVDVYRPEPSNDHFVVLGISILGMGLADRRLVFLSPSPVTNELKFFFQ